MSEKYFICEECGNLSTLSEQLEECESGGNGLCGCLFMEFEWNKETNDIDVWCPRVYPQWTKIKKKWYDKLKSESNHITRLKMFRCIPNKER